jgi:hypothetical protein
MYNLTYNSILRYITAFRNKEYAPKYNDNFKSDVLKFKNGDECPKNYFLVKDYQDTWRPCYGHKLEPEDCKSFEEFKDKLVVAQL